MASGSPKTSWFFTDPESRERDFVAEYRIRARCVSGNDIPDVGGYAKLGERDQDGYRILTLTGLTELFSLVEVWNCPITIAAPEGDLPWTLELEDGIRDSETEDDDEV